jgi:hypothetical protein
MNPAPLTPGLRAIVGREMIDRPAASSSQMMPTLDAQELAFSVGETQTRRSAAGIWGVG